MMYTMNKKILAFVRGAWQNLCGFYFKFNGLLYLDTFLYFLRFFFRTTCYIIQDLFTHDFEIVNVRVEQGELRGRKVKSVLGDTYYSFRGIPYAKPPVGSLRFKDPEPPKNWNGVKDATKHRNFSAQWDWITGIYIGNENSLFLNIYTPQIPEDHASSRKKAVLFWIHGGAFFFGFSNNFIYGADLFMSEDVVLVTINYRLGPLGFLTTRTEDAPGNAGFKDVIQALKWVNKNIAKFGGDPGNVTVFGESAGAVMAETLMLSPLAKGLFHKTISQSGSAMSWWGFNEKLVDCSFQLGRNLGIHTNDPKVLVESLQKLSPKSITLNQRLTLSDKRKRLCIPFDFTFCAEPVDQSNAALTSNPRELMLRGKIVSDVPFMIGINEKEGLSALHTTLIHHPEIEEFEKDFEKLIPPFLMLEPGTEQSKKLAAEMRKFYLHGKPINRSTYNGYVDLSTDIHFLEPFIASTRIHIQYCKSPVFNYKFEFEGDRNLFKKMLSFRNIKGPAHSDEAFYLFQIPGLGKNLNSNSKEYKTSKRMVRLWSNFAKYGNPTPDPNDSVLQNVVWSPAKEAGSPYLIIGEDLTVSTSRMWEERVKFLDEIKAKYAS